MFDWIRDNGLSTISGTDPKHGKGTSITGRTKYLARVPWCKRVCLSVDGLVLSVVSISGCWGVRGVAGGEEKGGGRLGAMLICMRRHDGRRRSKAGVGGLEGEHRSFSPLSLSLPPLSSLFTSPLFHSSLSLLSFPSRSLYSSLPPFLSLTPESTTNPAQQPHQPLNQKTPSFSS